MALQFLVLVPRPLAPVALPARAVEVPLDLVCCATKTFFLIHITLTQIVVLHRLSVTLLGRSIDRFRIRHSKAIDSLWFLFRRMRNRRVAGRKGIRRIVELLEKSLILALLYIFQLVPLIVQLFAQLNDRLGNCLV